MSNRDDLRKYILSMVGHKSYGLIAKEMNMSRSVVAGIVFRDKYPPRHRICSPNSTSPNKIGTGRRSDGLYAADTLPLGFAAIKKRERSE